MLRLWDDGKDSDFKEIPADIKERIARIEVAKHTLASSALDQLQEQHRKLTLSFAMLTSERQQGVVAGELRRVESRMEELEGELTPILERLDRIQDEQLAMMDRLDDLRRQMKESNNRAVGAALVEVFERIVLTFGSRDKAQPKKRHEPDTPWLKDETVFIYKNGDTRRIQDLDATRYESDGSRSLSDRNLDSVHGSPRMW